MNHGRGLRRSWLLALAACALGLGVFHGDNVVESLPHSPFKAAMGLLEALLMGPGMGLLAWLVSEHFRQKDAQQELAVQAERERRFVALGRIAAGLAHEIRNPLHNLTLLCGELRSHGQSEPALLTRIDANLTRIDQAVRLVYELGRPAPAATADHLHERSDLSAAVSEAIAAVTNARLRSGTPVIISHRPPALPALVAARQVSLAIILENLLRNAVEGAASAANESAAATPDATAAVLIEYGSTADSIILHLSNPGRLPPEVLTDAPVPSQKSDGLGVGLVIVRHLVRGLGASLTFTQGDGRVYARLALPTGAGPLSTDHAQPQHEPLQKAR